MQNLELMPQGRHRPEVQVARYLAEEVRVCLVVIAGVKSLTTGRSNHVFLLRRGVPCGVLLQ